MFRSNIKKNWSDLTLKGIQAGQLEMVTTIHKRSTMLAPVRSGALVNSSLIKRLSEFVLAITFGNSRVPYARRQYFENKTKSRWLEKAAEGVVRGDLSKYFRNKV